MYLFTFQHTLFSSHPVDLRLLAPISNHGQLASHIIQNELEIAKNFLDLDTSYWSPFILKAQKPGV